MRRILNASATCKISNPSRSIPLLATHHVNLMFENLLPIGTQVSIGNIVGANPFAEYEVYEDEGKILVKVKDIMVDVNLPIEELYRFEKFDPKFEE